KPEKLDVKPDLRSIEKGKGVNETVQQFDQVRNVKTEESNPKLDNTGIKEEQVPMNSHLLVMVIFPLCPPIRCSCETGSRPIKRLKAEED
ncbi:9813_t:CDS:2, partial [Acaulospora colombiana]